MAILVGDGIGTDFEAYADIAAFEVDYAVTKTNNPLLTFEEYLGKRYLRVDKNVTNFPSITAQAIGISQGSVENLQIQFRLAGGDSEVRLRVAVGGPTGFIYARALKNAGIGISLRVSGGSFETLSTSNPVVDEDLIAHGTVHIMSLTFDNTTGYVYAKIELQEGTFLYEVEETYPAAIGATGAIEWYQRRGSTGFADVGAFGLLDPTVYHPVLRQNLRLGLSDVTTNASVSKIQASESYFDREIGDLEAVGMFNVHLQRLATLRQIAINTDDDNKNYRYESTLDRMAKSYPPTFFQKSVDFDGAPATSQAEVFINAMLESWAADPKYDDWFSYLPCPVIHPFIQDSITLLYDEVIEAEHFGFLQDEDSPLSMLDILEQIFGDGKGAFPGYSLNETAEGIFFIRPANWAASYTEGVTALTYADFRTFSRSVPRDSTALANVIRFRSQGYRFASAQPLAGDSYLAYYGNGDTVPSGVIPGGRDEITGGTLELDNTIWENATITWELYCYDGTFTTEEFMQSGSFQMTPGTLLDLERTGVAGTGPFGGFNDDVKAVINFYMRDSSLSVFFNINKTTKDVRAGKTNINWVLYLDVAGDVYEQVADTIDVTVSTDSQVLGLEASQARYGIREESFSNNFWDFTEAEVIKIAQSLAAYLMLPKKHYRLALVPSVAAGYKMLPADIGKAYTLPTGATAVLKDYAMNADYTSDSPTEITEVEMQVVSDAGNDSSGDSGTFPGPTEMGSQSGTTYRRAIYRGG